MRCWRMAGLAAWVMLPTSPAVWSRPVDDPKIIPLDEHAIASILDHPNVFMGGPHPNSRRKARAILEYFAAEGWIAPVRKPDHAIMEE